MTPWDALTDACREANEAVIAAPYIKADALKRLLEQLRPDATLTCVTRWTARDMLFGASDVECRTLVLGRGGAFRLHPRLHAKYYRCGQRVLVGSANLTAHGMGYAPSANLEILCDPAPTFDAAAFERGLLAESSPVRDAEFEQWAAIVHIPPPPGPAVKALDPFDWRPATRDPEHVWLAYHGHLGRIPSADEQRLAQMDLGQLAPPSGLERPAFDNWVSVQLLGSSIVDDVRRTEGMERDEAWERLAVTWGTDKSEANRIRETVMNWTTQFLDSETE